MEESERIARSVCEIACGDCGVEGRAESVGDSSIKLRVLECQRLSVKLVLELDPNCLGLYGSTGVIKDD